LSGVTGEGSYSSIDRPIGSIGALDVPAAYVRPDVRLDLDLGQVRDLAAVDVNGHDAGQRNWAPYQWDVTSLLHTGSNSLRIGVTNSMANSSPGFGYDPAQASGLIDAPILMPRVRVTGTAGLIDDAPPPVPAGGAELLPNPGFETADATGQLPTGWQGEGVARFAWTTAPEHTGAHAVSVADQVSGGDPSDLTPPSAAAFWRPTSAVPVREGTAYAMAAWVTSSGAAPSAGIRFGLAWLDALDRPISTLIGPGESSDDGFHQLSWAVVAPAGATAAVPLFGMDSDFTSAGTVTIDDVSFRSLPASGVSTSW